jgi:hypothetical protein
VSLFIAFGSMTKTKEVDLFFKSFALIYIDFDIPIPALLVADQISRVLWQLVTTMHDVGDE